VVGERLRGVARGAPVRVDARPDCQCVVRDEGSLGWGIRASHRRPDDWCALVVSCHENYTAAGHKRPWHHSAHERVVGTW
jgi:hypothetical protein